MKARWMLCALGLVVTWAAPLVAQTIAPPNGYMNDRAGVVADPVERQLNEYLARLEQQAGVQFVVMIVPDIGAADIDQLGNELFNRWRLGAKGKDTGVLLLIAIKQRKYRFETGYGMEAELTDVETGRIAREHLIPRFKKNQFTEGVYATVLATIAQIGAERNIAVGGVPPAPQGRARDKGEKLAMLACPLAFFGLVMAAILVASAQRRRLRVGRGRWGGYYGPAVPWWAWWLLSSQMTRQRWGSGYGTHGSSGWGGGMFGGGGSFGGGGFGGGGFGGGGLSGGGGFSGGGGSSGGW